MLYIFGDTHGEWGKFNVHLNKLHQKHKDSIDVIVCGDFGYWPKESEYNLNKIKTFDGQIQIYFCPGNHEDWWSLLNIDTSDNKIIEIFNNIHYCKFGATKEFENKTFLFCGGAGSIDKNQRLLGYDWFPEEVISYRDMYELPQDETHIDVIISHTCPSSVFKYISKYIKLVNIDRKYHDPSCEFLSQIYDIFKPRKWYFGHFHAYNKFLHYNTHFTCLNYISGISKNNVCFK